MTDFIKGQRVIYNAETIVTFVRDLISPTAAEAIVELGGTTIVVPRALLAPLAR